MQTSSIVARIKRNAPDMQNQEILDYIDEVQTMMLSKPLNQRRLFDTSTGRDYQLTTVAGTFEYELASSDSAWAGTDAIYIERVFKTWDCEDGRQYDGYGKIPYNAHSSDPEYEVIDATNGTSAKVRFRNDPGTGEYYVTAYKKPVSITSTSIQLEVPELYHRTFVIEGVMGLIEQDENGASNTYVNFINSLDSFYQDMNRSKRNGTFGYRIQARGY